MSGLRFLSFFAGLFLGFIFPTVLYGKNPRVGGHFVNYQQHRISNYGLSDGMLSNNVLSVEQDKYGFMWIATSEGLMRYNGQDFVSFTKGTTNVSLSHNYAQYLISTRTGNVWIATSDGLNIYDYRGDSIVVIKEDGSGKGIASNDIICFSETSDGVWVASYDKGIDFYSYETKSFSTLALPAMITNDYITSLYADTVGNLWIGTLSQGLYCYSLKTKSTHYFKMPRVQAIQQDSYGTIWIAAEKLYYIQAGTNTLGNVFIPTTHTSYMGITRIREDNRKMLWVGGVLSLGYLDLEAFHECGQVDYVEIRQQGKYFGEPFRAVNCITIDRDDNIWVGTYGDGVYMIHNHKDKFRTLEHNVLDGTSLSGYKISGICESGGRLYVTMDGAGIDLLDEQMKKSTNYAIGRPNSAGLRNNNIQVVFVDSEQNLWCGNYGISVLYKGSGSFRSYLHNPLQPDKSLLSNTVQALAESADKSIWIGTDVGLTRYRDGKFSNEFYHTIGRRIDTRSIVVVGDYVWLGTYGDGIISLHIPTGKIESFSNNDNLTLNYIHEIKQHGDTLCATTQGGGLILFSLGRKKVIGMLTEANGLQSNYVQTIEFDKGGKIWMATNQGISYISPAGKVRHFDLKDGVLEDGFSCAYKTVDEDGVETIYFGGSQGINYFNPADLPQYTQNTEIRFCELRIDNQVVRPNLLVNGRTPLHENIILAQEIELSNKESFFSIGFAYLDYNNSQHTSYAYKLENFDTDWNDIGKQHEISFRNLPPGKYTLAVKASHITNGAQQQIARMDIIIHPPFYMTPVAYCFYVVFFLLMWYGIWRLSTIKMRARHRINMEKSERLKEEEIHQAKLRFFTNISHELRTPLTLIIGPLESLKLKYPSLSNELQAVSQNARKLLRLVNQLLDFRKIELKKMNLKISYASMTDQIEKAIAEFDYLRIEKNITLSFTSSPLKIVGWYDADFLEKIISNLISNAYKFTPQRGEISIEVSAKDKNGFEWVQLKIQDNGIGIDRKDVDLIFERFYQADTNTEGRGSGIGLNLVKSLVDLHKGTINVNSVLGKGTCFIIEIPIDKNFYDDSELVVPVPVEGSWAQTGVDVPAENPPELAAAQETQANSSIPKEQINILVVDDEIGICEYIKSLLPSYHVIFASNGKEALSILNQQDFDIVISDVMMPEMDGITLCEKIKKNIETSHIPVILLTAKSSIESKIEGLRTGADSYIAKPFHPQHLQIRVEKLIESRAMFKQKFGKTFSVEVEHNDKPSFDEVLLGRIIKYIDKHKSEPELNGDQIAQKLNISRMTLHRKLKLLTGQTTSQLIRGMRLKEAAYQIENTTKNISDICYEVGCNSPSYFTACFVEQYGMTPTEYLKMKRNRHV